MRDLINIVEGYSMSIVMPHVEAIVDTIHSPAGLVEWWNNIAQQVFEKLGLTLTWGEALTWFEDADNAARFKAIFLGIVLPKAHALVANFDGTIYRIMSVDASFIHKLQSPDATKKLGVYWGHDRATVEEFMNLSGPKVTKEYEIVLCAEVTDPQTIDWTAVLITGIELGDFESEIRLLPNAPIKVVWAEVDKERIEVRAQTIA